MAKIKIICDTCGKDFEKYESRIGKNNFCCRECYNKFHSKDTKIYKCEVCGQTFKGAKYNANRFCSRKCYDKFHAIKNRFRKCLRCGKEFEAKQSKRKYCCWECFAEMLHEKQQGANHPSWKGDAADRTKRWCSDYKHWRQNVLERDNYQCIECGSSEKLNAHHLKSWKNNPDLRFDITNGITLCEKCHIKWHQTYGYHDDKKQEENYYG